VGVCRPIMPCTPDDYPCSRISARMVSRVQYRPTLYPARRTP
jgi:hypothetical protein